MSNEKSHSPLTDEQKQEKKLRRMARSRVEFKQHLMSYLIINAALWAINYITQMDHGAIHWWAIWPTLGWGVGLAFHFIFTYIVDENTMVDREYRKLKKLYDKEHLK